MDPELLKALAEQGISVMLAGVVIYWFRSDSKERVNQADARAGEAMAREQAQRDDKLLMINVLSSNTSALADLKGAIERVGDDRARLVVPGSRVSEQRDGAD